MAQRVALVTGASSGIGEATARRLAEDGHLVYAAARRTDRMAGLTEFGIRVLKLDVTDDDSMVEVIDHIVREHARLDILVNNAGYGSYGALEDVPLDEARRQFEVNVFGLARLTQLALPHMRAQRDGYIVNISSIGGKIWEPLGGWYHATKFAVEGLSDSLRTEVHDFGIKVVIIEPGLIKTEWADISADSLVANSAGTPYGTQARNMAAVLRSMESSRSASGPGVVADAVAKAVASKRPRTRYAVGGSARPILAAKALLPDRVFDAAMRSAHRFVR